VGGVWRQGTSTDLTDRPESPNPNFCCQACEEDDGNAVGAHSDGAFGLPPLQASDGWAPDDSFPVW
jgi:hypothetical protein